MSHLLQILEVQMQNYLVDKLSMFNWEILHNILISLKSTCGYRAEWQSDDSFPLQMIFERFCYIHIMWDGR